jgi:hypothetical protein
MMMQMVRLFGLLGIVALIGASHAQSLADRLRDAGNISFQINNADYAVNLDLGQGCVQSFASGTTGAQNAFVINFEPGTLNFTTTLNQIVNSIASTQTVRFVASCQRQPHNLDGGEHFPARLHNHHHRGDRLPLPHR